MSKIVATFDEKIGIPQGVDIEAVLNALTTAIMVIDGSGHIIHINNAGEQFFNGSAAYLEKRRLQDLLPGDSPLFALLDQARDSGNAVSEYGAILETPRIGRNLVNIQALPLAETPDRVVLVLNKRSIADKIDRQLTHRDAARSVTAVAAMLAHEVKNPMSGIRGAAQLLEENASPEDRQLTQLIRDEVDRICALVDRMDIFNDAVPLQREAINIHQILDRVKRLAENGFGSHLRFIENYDPSLPPVFGNRDQLTQVFLNLVKNAAEAAPVIGGEIILCTAFRHGIRFAMPTGNNLVHLPLEVSIQDNGSGISEDIQPHLFEPFVSSKPKGNGLGLALAAKIIGDHAGVIEFESRPKRTIFRVMLPIDSSAKEGS
ncbi:MAG: two-component sensor histidine kinase [Rhodospirillales bacterium RIFCSPLOWO2_12_FULL_58_28]|nr:MAG: two-component sensor histidine kinase [Rhodospirillales bacterium RIFCSPLOWO2_02_FULL_58_16]OHC78816.1 MAG: two-component sensor histidine kinase [Rhodospirillales bacterium RIFCSPLOWO2_12_FULL_58_28]